MDERLTRLREQAAGGAGRPAAGAAGGPRSEDESSAKRVRFDERARADRRQREAERDGEADQDARSTKRRTEQEARGTRRRRAEEDQASEEPDRTSRRLAAVQKAINDIIEVHHDYAKKYNIKVDEKCNRETAKMMIDDLDKKLERRLIRFKDEGRNENGQKLEGGNKGDSSRGLLTTSHDVGSKRVWTRTIMVHGFDDIR